MISSDFDLEYHLSKNISKSEILDIETWIKADGCTLSEGVFLIHGKRPSNFLEHYKAYLEYPQELKCYHLAERSIKSGTLKAEKTKTGYWIDIGDILDWALDKEIGNLKTIEKLLTQRYRIKIERQEEILELLSSSTTNQSEKSTQSHILSGNVIKIFEEVTQARRQSINLALEEKFPERTQRDKHLNLIERFSSLPEAQFSKYLKGPKPRSLIIEHRCRSIGLFIRFFEPGTKIEELYNHQIMIKLGWRTSNKVTTKTFATWMYKEKIFDRNLQMSNQFAT